MKRITAIVFSLFFVNCGGTQVINAAPPQESTSPPTPTSSRVSWVKVNDGNQFWTTINSNDRNMALIGTEYCPPCEMVKVWWETKIAPPGWQFVYWQLNNSRDPLTRHIKGIFRELQEKDVLMVPYLSVIESAGDPRRKKSITETFRDFEECTVGANKFLLMHPQGTLTF